MINGPISVLPRKSPDLSVHKTWFRKSVGPQSFDQPMLNELYAESLDGMDTDLADEELAKHMSVEVQHVAKDA